MNPTYEQLRPLILRETVEGRTVAVVFADPTTGTRVASQAMMADNIGMGATIASQAAIQAQWTLRRELSQSIGRALGYGLFGQIARDTVDRAVAPMAANLRRDRVFDEDDRQAAIVRAFQAVQHHFRWDGSRWIGTSAPPQLTSTTTRALPDRGAPADRAAATPTGPYTPRPLVAPQAQTAPVPAPTTISLQPDRTIFLRMLVEVAGADGEVHADEAALFASIDPDADLVALRALPPLTGAELATVPADARELWLETAMAVALTDERLTQTESGRLATWRDAWQVPRSRAAELERRARELLVRLAVQALPADQREPLPRAVMGLAARLGIPPQRANQLAREA